MTTKNWRKTALITVSVVALISLYYTFSPTDSQFFPRCPTKVLTGLDCPGCGAQRALHAVLHGNFAEAISYNFFLVVGIPYLLAAVIAAAGTGRVAMWVRTRLLSPTMVWLYIILYLIWWVVRNILGI